jgi:hypothetical protein
MPLRNDATSASRARCWLKKESIRIPSLHRFDISQEQDGEVRGFIPINDTVSWSILARR